jgi:hypothetical protein
MPTYQDYGFVAAYLNAFPEIKAKVDQAVANNWTPEKLQGELKATNWWAQTEKARREWDMLSIEQPAEAQQRVDDMAQSLRRQAQQMGVTLPANIVDSARHMVAYQWSPEQQRQWIADQMGAITSTTAAVGAAGASVTQLRDLAGQYGIKLSDATLTEWTRAIVAGNTAPQGFEDYLRVQARGKYVGISEDLDRGVTVQQMFEPYRQAAAQALGVNPSDIDMSEDKWSKALTVSENGKSRAMTLDEWGRTLRTNAEYGFDKSSTAIGQARTLASAVQSEFGKRA